MLVLGRKVGETIHFFGHPAGPIVIKVEECRKGHVRLAFDAPHDIIIKRGEHVADNGITDTHEQDEPPSYGRPRP